jgi:hypothetical protein
MLILEKEAKEEEKAVSLKVKEARNSSQLKV